jgi:FkbM family methyltransferase
MDFAILTLSRADFCHPNAVDIGRHSNCPNDGWHDHVAPLLVPADGAPLVMLNVGANKGYNLGEWMQRYSAADVSNVRWHDWLMKSASPPCRMQCCGVCLVCKRRRTQQRATAPLAMHAFELQPSNERLLRQMARLSGAPVEVHGAAVSNASGTVFTRDSGAPGYESVAAQRAPPARRSARKGMVTRNVTTLDTFLDTRGIVRAGLVSIDTEGWDGLVLRGMARALAARRVDVVEFEYMRAWKAQLGTRALHDTLAWLHGFGYTCFWQGNRGGLAQASGGCWVEEFHERISHRWSNLVCAARADVLEALVSVSRGSAATSDAPG